MPISRELKLFTELCIRHCLVLGHLYLLQKKAGTDYPGASFCLQP